MKSLMGPRELFLKIHVVVVPFTTKYLVRLRQPFHTLVLGFIQVFLYLCESCNSSFHLLSFFLWFWLFTNKTWNTVDSSSCMSSIIDKRLIKHSKLLLLLCFIICFWIKIISCIRVYVKLYKNSSLNINSIDNG